MKYTIPLMLVSALLLSACGNKGPLVMPQKPVPVDVAEPAAKPQGEAQEVTTPEADAFAVPQEGSDAPTDTTSPPPTK